MNANSTKPQAVIETGWALASLALITLLSSLGTSIANIGLPTLAVAFNAKFQDVQWVVIAYLLSMTVLVVTMGRLGDLLGRRLLLLMGLIVFSLSSVCCGLASELWQLISARVLQGVGAAAMMALAMAFVGDIVPKENTGSAIGLLGTMSAMGTALGPSLGGALIAYLGWQSIFLINLPLGMFALFMAYRYLPQEVRAINRVRFDPFGTLLLALALVLYTLAVTLGYGDFGWVNLALFLGTVLATGVFIGVQQKVASPLVHLALFHNPVLSAGFVANNLVATVIMATLVVGPFYLTDALGLDAVGAGLVMSAGPIVSAITGVPAGRIVDRFGTQSSSLLGLLGMLLGASLLVVMPIHIAGYLAPLMVMTAGYALFQVANNTSVMVAGGQHQRGLVSGMLNLSRNLGLITGASVMGAIFAFSLKGVGGANLQATIAGMHLTFGISAILIAIALTFVAISLRINK